tara:strand:- start:388 stop:507 length:120 start_codon:yes stop_codon:yes gene_type:complete
MFRKTCHELSKKKPRPFVDRKGIKASEWKRQRKRERKKA